MTGISETTIEDRNSLLFFQIAEVLEFKPEQYDQATWGKFRIEHDDTVKMHGIVKEGALPNENDSRWKEVECGTTLCVAGHAANLSGYHPGAEKKTDRNTGEEYYELNWTYVFDTPHAHLQGYNTEANEASVVATRELGSARVKGVGCLTPRMSGRHRIYASSDWVSLYLPVTRTTAQKKTQKTTNRRNR